MKKLIIVLAVAAGLLFTTAFSYSRTGTSNNNFKSNGAQNTANYGTWNGHYRNAGWCHGKYSSSGGCSHWRGRLIGGHRCGWSSNTNNQWRGY